MFFFTFAHVSIRIAGLALLAVVGRSVVISVVLGDLALYFLVKALRNDLRYWAPIPSNSASWAASFLARFMCKFMADFTVLVQMRRKYSARSCLTVLHRVNFQFLTLTLIPSPPLFQTPMKSEE